MSKQPFDSRVLARIAESKIQEAMDNGEFDNLPGFGKPFEFDGMTHDPNWWIKEKLKRESLQNLIDKDFFRPSNR